MTWSVIAATEDHARLLAPLMAEPDKRECWAQAHLEPLEALLYSLRHSVLAYTAIVDEAPAVMFGVRAESMLSDTGYPWLLGRELDRHVSYLFLKHYRPFLDRMREAFPVLEACVDARHAKAIRWMKWAGFTIAEPIAGGPDALAFHPVLIGA